jgi:glycosyltransferase involved in cell wall biosynthesis
MRENAAAEAGEGPLVSVVICTYARHASLRETIASVQNQTLPRERYEIVVVDNSPDQAAAARVAEQYRGEPRLRYLLEPRPGASNARNVGALAALGRHVAFIDDDIVASRGWLRALLDGFAAHPDAGVVGGRVVARWVSPRPDWLHDQLLDYLSLTHWGDATHVTQPHEWLGSGNMAVVRDEFLAAGGFSRALGRRGSGEVMLSNEDTEFVDRLRARGRSAVYCPGAVVEHVIDAGRLNPAWFRRRAAWQAVSDFLAAPGRAAGRATDSAARLRVAALARPEALRGLFNETDDPAKVLEQVQVSYHVTLVLLAGGVTVEPTWLDRVARRRVPHGG